jgi:hypothetical protein
VKPASEPCFPPQTKTSAETLTEKDDKMAKKPNYGYEKRQKEIAKKAKKEEKKKRKLDDGSEEPPEED